ncbi:unnamed protein product, partial [Allacma fusca]
MIKSTDPKKPIVSYICQTSGKENRDEWVENLRFILQTQKDFLKAIQSPIKYQKNKLTKEVSAPDLWAKSERHSNSSTKPVNSLESPALRSFPQISESFLIVCEPGGMLGDAISKPTQDPSQGPRTNNPLEASILTSDSSHVSTSCLTESAEMIVGTCQYPPPPPMPPPSFILPTVKAQKKYILNGWRTSIRTKTRTNNRGFATTTSPPRTPCQPSNGEFSSATRRWSESSSRPLPHKLNQLQSDCISSRGSNPCTQIIPIPPGSVVKALSDFQAVKPEEASVTKGELVQILGMNHKIGYYFVRKFEISNSEGWSPASVLQHPTLCLDSCTSGRKPWSFRFRMKPHFHRRDKDSVNSSLCGPADLIDGDVVDLVDELVPVFSVELQSVRFQSGERVVLQCQIRVVRKESVVVEWKDAFGHVIRNSNRHEVTFNEDGVATLIIYECRVYDSGRLTCIATTDAGSNSTSCVLSVTAVPPSRPSPAIIRSVDSDSVELEWKSTEKGVPGSNAVKFFTVQHCISECDVWTSCAVVADSFCKVQHLTPGQMYSFRIISHGEGSTRSEPSLPSESVIIPPSSPLAPKTPTSQHCPHDFILSCDCSINNKTITSDSSRDLDFYKRYVELEDIDRGRFSVVRKCQEVSSGQELAVKFVHIKRWKKQLIMKEYQILSAISHPNVIQAHAFCETALYSAIVTEYVNGTSLFSYLCEQDFYMEYTVATLMLQLFQAVEHIHKLEIAHLDIEPSNILIDKTVLPPALKLVDFGDACHVAEGSPDCLPHTLPSFEFASPEVLLRQKCSVFSDIWSLGVLIYLLLSGTFPFMSESFEKMSANIINCYYRFGLESFKGISYEAKDLIRHMLVSNSAERISATQCINSIWVRQARKFVTPLGKTRLEPYLDSKTIENGLRRKKDLKRFCVRRKASFEFFIVELKMRKSVKIQIISLPLS